MFRTIKTIKSSQIYSVETSTRGDLMNSRKHQIVVFIIIISVLFLISCGRGHRSSVATDNLSVLSNSGVSVTVFDNTGKVVSNPSVKYSLSVTKAGDCRQVVVTLKQQDSMRTCFLEVQFDGTREHPTEIQCGSALLKHQPLSYLGSPEAGKVVSAQVILGNESFEVNGELLRIKLIAGSHQVRTVSGFNQNPTSDPILADVSVDPFDQNKVCWTYKLRGDADNSQVFDFADFGAVGESYGASIKSNPALEPADANNNGLIDFADFGVIGANYGRGIGGVKIYRDDNPEPSTLIGILSTNPKFIGDYRIKSTTNSVLPTGFKRYWLNETNGSGQHFKLELVDLSKINLDGQVQTTDAHITKYTAVDDWSMFGHDAQHTCRSPFIGPATNALKWSFKTDGYMYSSPVMSPDGTIYVTCSNGMLYAINSDGSEKWKQYINANGKTSPAINISGLILISGSDNRLYALNPNGKLQWLFNTGSKIESSPTIDINGTIYIGSNDDNLYAINQNGSQKWNFKSGGDVVSTPAIGCDGTIYFGSKDNKIYAINSDGKEKWSFETEGEVIASPVIAPSGLIYIGSADRKLYALNPDGTLNWSYETQGEIESTPAIGSKGDIYVSSSDFNLYVINPNGTKKWDKKIGDTLSSPVLSTNDTVYIGCENTYLYSIDQNGKEVWTYKTEGPIESTPAIGKDGTVYFGSSDKNLYAVGPGYGNSQLEPPSNIAASDGPSDGSIADKIKITWEIPISGFDPSGYRIYRANVENGVYELIGTTDTETVFFDSAVLNTNIYYYKVSSTRNAIHSELSQSDAGSLKSGLHPEIKPPVDLKASDGTHTAKILLTWKAPTNGESPDGYKIYRGVSLTGIFSNIAVVGTVNSYEDATAKEAVNYFYKLTTIKESEESDYCKPDLGSVNISSIHENWTMLGGNQRHNGQSRFVGPASNDIKWTLYCKGASLSSPVIGTDDTLYFSNWDQFHAVNPDGSIKWTHDEGELYDTTPAIGQDNTVYIGSTDKKLYAINPNGSTKWAFETNGDIYTSPTISQDGIIYFVNNNNYLYALYPDGNMKWMFKTGNKEKSSPAIGVDGTIYVGSVDNKLDAINPDGSIKWSFNTLASVVSTPVLNDKGSILVVSNDAYLFAINQDGSMEWKYKSDKGQITSPAIGPDGSVYFSCANGSLIALSANRTHKWTYNFEYNLGYVSPIVDKNGTIFFVDEKKYQNHISAINPEGKLIWRTAERMYFNQSPTIGKDGTLYCSSFFGDLYAIGPGSGSSELLPPVDLEATKGSEWQKVIIKWSAPAFGVVPDGYQIYKSDSPDGIYSLIGVVGQVFKFVDRFSTDSKPYYYKVASTKDSVESVFTQETVGFIYFDCKKGDWSMNGKDNTHSNRSSFTGPQTNSVSSEFIVEETPKSTPVFDSLGKMYFIENISFSYNCIVSGYDQDNSSIWKYSPIEFIRGSLAISYDSIIYFGCDGNKFYALFPNGAEKWTFKTDGAIYASPTIGKYETIFFGCNDNKVYALNPDGTLIWTYFNDVKIEPSIYPTRAFSTPAIGLDNTIYINGLDSKLLALSDLGKLKWEIKTKGHLIDYSPAIGLDGSIYVNDSIDLYSINPNGKINWTYAMPGRVSEMPAIGSDGTIIIGSNDTYLYAINPDGSLKWKCKTSNSLVTIPIVDAQNTVFIASENEIYAINSDGSLKWEYQSIDPLTPPVFNQEGSIVTFSHSSTVKKCITIGQGSGN